MRIYPIWLERRLSSLHIGFYGLYNWKSAPKIAAMFWLGISYIPEDTIWRFFGNSVESSGKIPMAKVQGRLDQFLRSIRLVRSLEIRTHFTLDYHELGNLAKLRHLSLTGQVAQVVDLSSCKSLETISGNHSSMSKLAGLSELAKLREVYANRVSVTWIRSLPISVTKLFFTGPLPESLDLGILPNLKTLGFTQLKVLNLSQISSKPTEVSELLLTRIKQIENLHQLPLVFPKLKVIVFENVSETLMVEVKKTYSGSYRFIEK